MSINELYSVEKEEVILVGQNEDEANAKSGELIKKFEKHHPDDESKMYD
jgi:hypothetical protein